MYRRTCGLTLLALVLAACGGSAGSALTPFEPAAPVSVPTSTSTTAGSPLPTTTIAPTTTLPPLPPSTFESIAGINTVHDFARRFGSRGLTRWEQEVPGVADIRIVSSVDGVEQPALWLPPLGDRPRPLLVVLHSWSSPYDQHASIPFAMWAQENGWAAIAPQFRGVNDDAEAMGSDLAVQDVADAIDYAIAQGGVDANRVYAVGLSGGGMMALLLAGRHPERLAAVAAWSPVFDLVAFYQQSRSAATDYRGLIRRVCGGAPTNPGPAQDECRQRSPITYLDTARENGVPVYIGQGIGDTLLRPSNAANAFNQLADPDDRLSQDEVDEIGRRRVPEHLAGEVTIETFFAEGDPEPVFARQSAAVWLVFFPGNHDMVYGPALRWFATDPR